MPFKLKVWCGNLEIRGQNEWKCLKFTMDTNGLMIYSGSVHIQLDELFQILNLFEKDLNLKGLEPHWNNITMIFKPWDDDY